MRINMNGNSIEWKREKNGRRQIVEKKSNKKKDKERKKIKAYIWNIAGILMKI